MNKNDISDAFDFLDEDMIRHTQMLRKEWAQGKGISKIRGMWIHFCKNSGIAAAACLILSGILIALLVVAIGRRASEGKEEWSAQEFELPIMGETDTSNGGETENFVSIASLLAQLEREEGASGEMSTEEDMLLSAVDLGEHVGLYEVISQSHLEGGILSQSVGSKVTESEEAAESTAGEEKESASSSGSRKTETADGYYRVAGHEDLQYLIYKETHTVYAGEGTYAYTEDGELIEADYYFLLKFVCFDSEEYAYSDVLSLVYQIHSAEDIKQILVKPSKADNSETGKALQEQIGESTVTEADDIEAFYEILSSLTCYGSDRWDLIDLGNWEIAADAATGYDSHAWSRVWVERYLTLTTDYGNEIDGLKYTAYSDMFYEFGGIAYSAMSEEQAEVICEILGIDADETVSSSISE